MALNREVFSMSSSGSKYFFPIILFLVAIAANAVAQDSVNQLPSKMPNTGTEHTEFNGTIVAASIGFAPLPAYSFDHPIAIVFLSIKKNRLSYEPGFSIGFNGKPWMMDNWLRYVIIDKNSLAISAAVDPSLFFKIERSDPKPTITAQRNVCADVSVSYRSSKSMLTQASFQYVHGFEYGTPSGTILILKVFLAKVSLPGMMYLDLTPQVVRFDFTGSNNGLFALGTVNLGRQRWPIKIFLQGVQRMWCNFRVESFRCSFGLMYSLTDKKR